MSLRPLQVVCGKKGGEERVAFHTLDGLSAPGSGADSPRCRGQRTYRAGAGFGNAKCKSCGALREPPEVESGVHRIGSTPGSKPSHSWASPPSLRAAGSLGLRLGV